MSPTDVACAVDREQTLGSIITAYNDVTDRLKEAYERLQHEVRRLREELQRKNEELRRSERLAALGEMAAGLAHEVRNPLGGIALHASLLERDLSDRPQSAVLAGRIREGVRTLDRLVGDVLSFAQEGRLCRERVTACAMIDRVLPRVQPMVERHATRLVVDDGLGAETILADAGRMEQVLLNLLLNAVQAAGRDGRVTLTARRAADGGAEFVVSDDGPGIAADELERIFNPFFTTKPDGTGLGLPIVHRIIEAHGGRIRVRSAPGSGAEFTVWLPGE